MVLNPDECSFILSGVKDELQADFVTNNVTIKTSKNEKALGLIFDNRLDFSTHQTSITKKVNIKLNALNRVNHFLNIPLYKALI